jgi:RNA polymerase sigma-70 factor (ECF subfamily)
LYAIATRAFLKALERRRRRPLPSDLHAPEADPTARVLAGDAHLAWLQPAPDSLLAATTSDPATVVAARDTMRLAFIAALQLLSPQQRAALVLREVLGWSAAEVAALLDLTVAAVNGALQRARTHLPAATDSLAQPSEQRQRELLDRYVAAFQNADVDALLAVLTEDARYEMPPFLTWFDSSAAIGAFLGPHMRAFGKTPVIPTTANGQPAVAFYPATPDGQHRLRVLHLLTLTRTASGGSWPSWTPTCCGTLTCPSNCRPKQSRRRRRCVAPETGSSPASSTGIRSVRMTRVTEAQPRQSHDAALDQCSGRGR